VSALAAESNKAPAARPVSGARPAAVDRRARLRAAVEEHYDFVWRSLRRLGVVAADAEDAAQEVFVSFSKRIDDVEVGRERAFLYRTALNHAAHVHRSRLRRREVSDAVLDEQPASQPNPEQALVSSRERQLFYVVLDQLELDLRAVFVLYELERFTMAEIADLLALPPGTVASRLRRARREFLEHVRLEESAEGGSP